MLVAALAIGSVGALGAIKWAPNAASGHLAVVFPPWVRNADAIVRAADAGADLIRTGRFSFVTIVRPRTIGFTRAVLRKGALMVLDAGSPGGCFRAASPS